MHRIHQGCLEWDIFCKIAFVNHKHIRMDVEIFLDLIVKSNISRCTWNFFILGKKKYFIQCISNEFLNIWSVWFYNIGLLFHFLNCPKWIYNMWYISLHYSTHIIIGLIIYYPEWQYQLWRDQKMTYKDLTFHFDSPHTSVSQTIRKPHLPKSSCERQISFSITSCFYITSDGWHILQ